MVCSWPSSGSATNEASDAVVVEAEDVYGGDSSCTSGSPMSRRVTTASGSPLLRRVTRDLSFHTVPMWVCPVTSVSRLGSIQMHEDMVRQGLLQDLRQHDGEYGCSFVSQTWMSFDHPDPEGVKYRLLVDVLDAMVSCKFTSPLYWEEVLFVGYSCITAEEARAATRDGFVWFDFWSVPQRDPCVQQSYIDSIPFYVQACSLFIALVPPSKHVDTCEIVDRRTWAGRGWCRMERIANCLSKNPSPVLMVESCAAHWKASPKDWLMNPVGQGSFSCCQLRHVLPCGRAIQCDKVRIQRSLETIVNEKMQAFRETGDLFHFRLVLALRDQLLSGLPPRGRARGPQEGGYECTPAVPRWMPAGVDIHGASALTRWLQEFHFSCPLAEAASGWTPLRFAMYQGRLDIAELLLEARADVDSPLEGNKDSAYIHLHDKGLSILQGVCLLRRESPELVRFLVRHRADVNRKSRNSICAAFSCAIGCSAANLEALVDAGADVRATDVMGTGLLTIIAMHGNTDLLQVCDRRCPELVRELDECSGSGMGLLIASVMHGNSTAIMHALLSMGADLNFKIEGMALNPFKVLQRASQLACFLKEPHPHSVESILANLPGSTPLIMAAMFGHMPALLLLLEKKADVRASNDYGRTPLVFAAMRGQREMCDVLVAAGVPKEPKDRWGRDAAAWAERVGDASLAHHLRSG